MSAPNDDPVDMRAPSPDPLALDPVMADALLDGRVDAGDAPPGYGAVVAVLLAADAPIRSDETEGGPEAIRRIFEEARRSPAPVPGPSAGDSRRLVGRWSLRAVVVAVVATFTIGGGVAMAATGNLPGPLQSAANRTLGAIGVTVPDGSDGGSAGESDQSTDVVPPGAEPTATTDPVSVPVESTATTLPTAAPPTEPPTTRAVTTDPVTSPSIADPATSPSTDSTGGVPGRGDEVCAEASDDRCRAGEPNPSDTRPDHPGDDGPPTTKSNPSVTAPGRPGED